MKNKGLVVEYTIIFIAFLVFLVWTIDEVLQLNKIYHIKKNGIKTNAIIIKKYTGSGAEDFYGVFTRYKTIKGTFKEGKYLIPYDDYLKYKIGDSIEVIYNRINPDLSTLYRKNIELWNTVFFIILGAPLTIFMFLLLIANPHGNKTRAIIDSIMHKISRH